MSTQEDEKLLKEFFERAIQSSEDQYSASMFSSIVKDKPVLVRTATELIANKIQSANIQHSMRTLQFLEECMSKCGNEFQNEVSKNRFLNKLIKLVSINHLAEQTPKEVRDKIMDCLLLWTVLYPEKDKIRLAYDSLNKQGNQHGSIASNITMPNVNTSKRATFIDAETEVTLKKLLQSKNEADLKKAQLLIKHYFGKDKNRTDRIMHQKAELKNIEDTVNVFDQVLDSYVKENNIANNDTLSLINGLKDSCEKYKSIVCKMPGIIEASEEDLIAYTLFVNDNLLAVIDKYKNIFDEKNTSKTTKEEKPINFRVDDLLGEISSETVVAPSVLNEKHESNCTDPLAELSEIFRKSQLCSNPNGDYKNALDENVPDALRIKIPIKPDLSPTKHISNPQTSKIDYDSLTGIDKISDDLFKESLKPNERLKTFKKEMEKKSLNELAAKSSKYEMTIQATLEDDVELLGSTCNISDNSNSNEKLNLLMKPTKNLGVKKKETSSKTSPSSSEVRSTPLSEINIDLNDVIPRNCLPKKLIDEPNGLKMLLNFTDNNPAKNVHVIVISADNQSSLNIENFYFDASVPKPCKLRLLSPTGTMLQGKKPFRSPSGLQQAMLLFNPTEKPVDITCILSYKLGDDPDPIKESIIASNIQC